MIGASLMESLWKISTLDLDFDSEKSIHVEFFFFLKFSMKEISKKNNNNKYFSIVSDLNELLSMNLIYEFMNSIE